jgi:hypothetical protein
MPPDFLNSREDAFLLYTLLVVCYLIVKDARGIAASFLRVVAAALHPKLALLFASALVYTLLVLYAAREVGLWHTSSLKTTVYWFVGTALVLISDAVTGAVPADVDFTRRILKRVISVTILIEFVVNLYVFPLAVEVIGVGIAVTFTLVKLVVEHDASAEPRVRKLVEGVIATVGFVYLGYFGLRALGDLVDGAVSRQRVEELLVAPGLTIAMIPLLYIVAWWSRRERERLRRRFRVRQGRLEGAGTEEPFAESNRAPAA